MDKEHLVTLLQVISALPESAVQRALEASDLSDEAWAETLAALEAATN